MDAAQIGVLRSKVQKATAFFKPLVDLEGLLGDITALDSTRVNIEAAIAIRTEELDEVNLSLSHARDMVVEAKEHAAAIVSEATAKIDDMMASAHDKVAISIAELDAQITEKQKELDGVTGKVSAAMGQLVTLQGEINADRDIRARLEAEIEALKARFA
jgi:chromosome segregation ATPase